MSEQDTSTTERVAQMERAMHPSNTAPEPTERQRITIPRFDGDVTIEALSFEDGSVSLCSPGLTMIFDQAPVALDGKAATIPKAGHMRVMAYVDSAGLTVSLKLDGHGMWNLAEHLTAEGVRVERLAVGP